MRMNSAYRWSNEKFSSFLLCFRSFDSRHKKRKSSPPPPLLRIFISWEAAPCWFLMDWHRENGSLDQAEWEKLSKRWQLITFLFLISFFCSFDGVANAFLYEKSSKTFLHQQYSSNQTCSISFLDWDVLFANKLEPQCNETTFKHSYAYIA